MNVRLINLTDDDKMTSRKALSSYNLAIGEGNSEYYFFFETISISRKSQNKKAVDSGERVGADDVIFSTEPS